MGHSCATPPAGTPAVPWCPRGARCECCGAEAGRLSVVLVDLPTGQGCLTACPRCAAGLAAGCRPPIAASTAVRLAEQHSRHVTGPHRGRRGG